MLYAAPCIAVSPSLFTALISAPRSSNIFTASSASFSSPASSNGSVVPRPAAAIRGVVLLKFGTRGSAPNSTSTRISGTSERSAAKRNAVAPSDSILEDVLGCLGAPLERRKLTFAPRFTISRTNSRLVRRPAPAGGAGSLLSLESGFRTQLIVWSAVNPDRTSLGSAPASTSAIASSKCPFCTASSNGLVPLSTDLIYEPAVDLGAFSGRGTVA